MKSRSTWLGVVLVAFSGGAIVSGQVTGNAPASLPTKPRFILRDHKDVAWCVAFAPDGKSLVTCTGNRGAVFGDLRGYDLTTGTPVQTFLAREPHGIRWVAYDPSGKLVATAEYDGMVRIRDAATGKVQSALSAHTGGVQCLKFTRESRSLVTCGKDKKAIVWDLATSKVKTTMVVDTDYVYSLDVSPDEQTLLTGANEPKATLWDMATGERKRNVPGNKHAIEAVRFSPDGKLYATAGWDGIVNVRDAATGAHRNALGGPSGWGILSLAFTPDSKYLLAGTQIGALRLWDVTSGNVLDTMEAHAGNIRAITFSPDGKMMATASHDATVKLWDWDH
jgi:WD40 repeat protein